jgi:hypothetical protein
MDAAANPADFRSSPAWWIAGGILLLHLAVASRYGYFGDELYFLACGEHLDWGYVDQPPMIGLVAWLVRHTLGTSVLAIRSVSAVAAAALVVLTGRIAYELGGARFAQALAALCAGFGGVFLVLGYLFTMNAFEPLMWTACAWVVIRIIKTGDQRLWLWFGVIAGLGLENKYSMGVFGFAIVVGLLLTPERKALGHKWIWIAGALAFALFLPNVIWNIANHFPFLELMRNIRASGRDVQLGPVEYLVQQIVVMNPATLPVWLAGVVYLFLPRNGQFRMVGWTFLAVLATFMLLKGKDYYSAGAYPMVMAAGGVAIEDFVRRRGHGWIRPALVILLLGMSAFIMPLVLPVLSVEGYLRWQTGNPIVPQPSEVSHRAAALPHHYAWQFGWEEMVAAVAAAYHSLTPEEQKKAAIFADNYAEAGAIDLLGGKYGLPKAIGGHQSYFLWGPRQYTGEVVILVGQRPAQAQENFKRVDVAANLHHPYGAVWENKPVLICHGLKYNLQEIWPKVKIWD